MEKLIANIFGRFIKTGPISQILEAAFWVISEKFYHKD